MKPYLFSLRAFVKVARLCQKPVRETMNQLCQRNWIKVVKVDGKTYFSMSVRALMSLMNLKSPAPLEARINHLRAKGFI